MVKCFAIGSARHCVVMGSIILLESFKEKKIKNIYIYKKSQNGKYLMSAVSVLLLIDFLATYLQKAFTPGEKPEYKMSYWATDKCRFIFLFFPVSLSGITTEPTFSLGSL